MDFRCFVCWQHRKKATEKTTGSSVCILHCQYSSYGLHKPVLALYKFVFEKETSVLQLFLPPTYVDLCSVYAV